MKGAPLKITVTTTTIATFTICYAAIADEAYPIC